MTEQFINEAHAVYIEIFKSILTKIQKKHPNENPNKILEAALQSIGQFFVEFGDFSVSEAFILLGLIAAKPFAMTFKTEGPAEVAKNIKGMSELFAYTLLDRVPDIIDQATQQEKAQRAKNNKVILPS